MFVEFSLGLKVIIIFLCKQVFKSRFRYSGSALF